jgi:hypothetical protein
MNVKINEYIFVSKKSEISVVIDPESQLNGITIFIEHFNEINTFSFYQLHIVWFNSHHFCQFLFQLNDFASIWTRKTIILSIIFTEDLNLKLFHFG